MKKTFFILFALVSFAASAQKIDKKVVEVSCGECQFKMKGKGCDMAVRIEGKTYFVDGDKIDKHGDAHADDGLCNAVREAEVSGEIVGDRFKATSIKLLPLKKK
ncbi:MAG: hypothetical protein CFE23_15255 [Flavobacterium sp. BFFFF1]|uniref:DUF6370 family protein n=1 Tax=unclassified Flavobacterium TaxID=196869 RepID=UPI000BD83D01|nr:MULTISPECIES: DUF6370 family protein [unclassified Flavobacterium]OYU79193.1 MAG: hypothetical protein CFE23_15255 [Flavobacterium sp. BFFFF1]